MSSRFIAALTTPGPWVFALLNALDGMSRACLAALLPLVALDVVGSARNVSAVFSAVGWAGLAATFTIPWLVRRFRADAVYTLGGILLVVSPILFWTSTTMGLVGGLLLRAVAMACTNIVISLYIMEYIPKQMLGRSEPLRTFAAAFAWSFGPWFGVWLYQSGSPAGVFLFSAVVACVFLTYFRGLGMAPPIAANRSVGRSASPWANIRRFVAQPRLVLAWLLNFGRECWWVAFFVYIPITMVQAGESATTGALVLSCGTAFLFVTPLMGWFGRRFGLRRVFIACFIAMASLTTATGLLFEQHWLAAGLQLGAALCAVTLDSVGYIPFMRAVRARERPEMTMVFGTYRDIAWLFPTMLFTVLLSVFDLSVVYLTTGLALFGFAFLARWIPRGM
jgi:MFS family permease